MRYNKSQIMKMAHRTYKYVGKKQGKSFGECLKSTWRLAKLNVEVEEAREKRLAEEALKYAQWKEADKKVVSHDDKYRHIDFDPYNRNSRGYLGSQYCGD